MKMLDVITKNGILKEGSNGADVKVLQDLLRAAGHELVVDGDFGTITRVAVERFQAAHGIAADGMVGPITAAYLDAHYSTPATTQPLPTIVKVAPWLAYMRALTGTREIPGARSNPLILSWVRSLGSRYPRLKPNISWYVNDDTPWCGLGCAEAVGECDPGYMPPDAPLRALNWSTWGTKMDVPVTGSIAVKQRVGGGHVTMVESVWKGKIYCRGANQSDMINVSLYNTADFFAFRWPSGAALPPMKVTNKQFNVGTGTEI